MWIIKLCNVICSKIEAIFISGSIKRGSRLATRWRCSTIRWRHNVDIKTKLLGKVSYMSPTDINQSLMFAGINSLRLLNVSPIFATCSNQSSPSCFFRTIAYTVSALHTFLPGFQGMDSLMEKKNLTNKTAVSVADVWKVKCGRCAGAKGNSRTRYCISVGFLNWPRPRRQAETGLLCFFFFFSWWFLTASSKD